MIALVFCTTLLGNTKVTYQAVFTGKWSADYFADGPKFPEKKNHFTPLFLLSHNDDLVIFRLGELASKAVEKLVEEGEGDLMTDFVTKENGKNYFSFKFGAKISKGVSRATRTFRASDKSPYFSSINMIAPSPDWFVGVDSLPLKDSSGKWYSKITCELFAYDAGTELGDAFRQNNSASKPVKTIDFLNNREQIKEAGYDFSKPFAVLELTLREDGLEADLIGGEKTDCSRQ